jgi:hypothetical protein
MRSVEQLSKQLGLRTYYLKMTKRVTENGLRLGISKSKNNFWRKVQVSNRWRAHQKTILRLINIDSKSDG